ncbi:MAG: DUF4248 domain-containing protein [Tannerellaceae bacterium]|nr:DUF4248 domain-containing protein [Tannerellaceae bacterium]
MSIEKEEFIIKSYTWKEIACLYNPGFKPDTATKRLRQWLAIHPTLIRELEEAGWKKGMKVLTPMQIKVLVGCLGDPP